MTTFNQKESISSFFSRLAERTGGNYINLPQIGKWEVRTNNYLVGVQQYPNSNKFKVMAYSKSGVILEEKHEVPSQTPFLGDLLVPKIRKVYIKLLQSIIEEEET